MRSLKLLALCATLAAFLLASAGSGQVGFGQGACTVTVSSGQSIEAAINNAPTNAVICLGAGTWQEDLTITRDGLTLLGQGPTKSIVIGALVIQVAGPFTVEGLSLGRAPTVSGGSNSCTVTLTPGQSIQPAIDGAAAGAVLCLGAGTYAEQITIQDKQLVLRGAGRDQTILDGSTISKTRQAGIEVAGRSQVSIDGLTVRNFAEKLQVAYFDGLYVHDGAQVTAEDSEFSGNSDNGIWVTGTARIRLINNVITTNGGYGIAVSGPNNILECRGNTLSGNGRGDFLNKSGDNEAVAQECR
jgi:parallel beta-helix repeat protein